MTELIALGQQLGGVGFPTLLLVILYGSFKNKWMWTSVHLAREEEWERRILECEKRLAKEEQSKTRWETMALSTVGLVEDRVGAKRPSL